MRKHTARKPATLRLWQNRVPKLYVRRRWWPRPIVIVMN